MYKDEEKHDLIDFSFLRLCFILVTNGTELDLIKLPDIAKRLNVRTRYNKSIGLNFD